jgi:hypothetical protein
MLQVYEFKTKSFGFAMDGVDALGRRTDSAELPQLEFGVDDGKFSGRGGRRHPCDVQFFSD